MGKSWDVTAHATRYTHLALPGDLVANGPGGHWSNYPSQSRWRVWLIADLDLVSLQPPHDLDFSNSGENGTLAGLCVLMYVKHQCRGELIGYHPGKKLLLAILALALTVEVSPVVAGKSNRNLVKRSVPSYSEQPGRHSNVSNASGAAAYMSN